MSASFDRWDCEVEIVRGHIRQAVLRKRRHMRSPRLRRPFELFLVKTGDGNRGTEKEICRNPQDVGDVAACKIRPALRRIADRICSACRP